MPHPLSKLLYELSMGRAVSFWTDDQKLEWCQRNQVKLFEREFIELVLFQSFNLWAEFVGSGSAEIYLKEIKPVIDRWYIKRMTAFEQQGKLLGQDKNRNPKRDAPKKQIQAKMRGSLFPEKSTLGDAICPKCFKGKLVVDESFRLCEFSPKCDYFEVI